MQEVYEENDSFGLHVVGKMQIALVQLNHFHQMHQVDLLVVEFRLMLMQMYLQPWIQGGKPGHADGLNYTDT